MASTCCVHFRRAQHRLKQNLSISTGVFSVPSHFLHLLQFPADYHVISISGSVCRKPNEHCKILHCETSKSKKAFSFWGALPPRPPDQGLCPCTPLRAQPPDPRYRLALPRSPYLCAPLKFVLAPLGLKFWRRRWGHCQNRDTRQNVKPYINSSTIKFNWTLNLRAILLRSSSPPASNSE